jgi:hypothetical protein
MKKIYNDWRIIILLCLTLGLAPLSPQISVSKETLKITKPFKSDV